MLVFKAKLKSQHEQCPRLNRAIWSADFVRGCLTNGKDCQNIRNSNLDQARWVIKINTMAKRAKVEGVWSAVVRFFDNCQNIQPGKTPYLSYPKRTLLLASQVVKAQGSRSDFEHSPTHLNFV